MFVQFHFAQCTYPFTYGTINVRLRSTQGFLGKFGVELREDIIERVDAQVVDLTLLPAVLTSNITQLVRRVSAQRINAIRRGRGDLRQSTTFEKTLLRKR